MSEFQSFLTSNVPPVDSQPVERDLEGQFIRGEIYKINAAIRKLSGSARNSGHRDGLIREYEQRRDMLEEQLRG